MKHPCLTEYLIKFAADSPDKPLLGDRNGWLTAALVLRRVEDTAGRLYALGLRAGDWAALRIPQTAEAAGMLLALQALGVVTALTDPRTSVLQGLDGASLCREIAFSLTDEDGVWALARKDGRIPLDSVAPVPYVSGGDPMGPAMVIFTSGSTGKSKGVILSQNNLISNLLDSAPLGGYSEDDIALGALPMHHVFGLALLTGAIVLRYSLYLTPGGDLDTVLSAIQEQGITRMNGVPALYLNMARNKGSYDLRTLRVGYIGASACTPEQFAEMEEGLGMTLVSVYGMSECIGISCASCQDPRAVRSGGVGKFYPMNQGKILREDGTEAAPGEIGEVCVSGPMRMLGYCDDAETKEAVDEQGFLHTGDLGFVDETGVLHLTGRKKDIIIRNGVNLSPRRIEEALLAIPGVVQAVVVGIPHPVQGEVPCAMAVSRHGELTLTAQLSRRLPKNEIPVGISVVEQIPLTASGKPDKVKIREVLIQWAKAQS